MISKIKLGGSEFRFIMKDNFRDKIADTDNFWDIEGMLPEKKPSHRFSHDTSTVEIKLSGEDDTERGQIIPLDNRHPGGTSPLPKNSKKSRLPWREKRSGTQR